ncbi:Sarcosine oxidase subunit alpha OS=Castellaniella defragrans OX=75697 GN=HNR28_002015 PE=3 SV=1 [Castellaniella defragrans]
MGFGTDQGKLGNINGMAVLAEALKQTIPETGTTTFRPNYTPVSFGSIRRARAGGLLRSHSQDQPLRLERGGAARSLKTSATGSGRTTTRSRARTWTRPCAASAWPCANGVGLLDYSTLG